MLTAPHNACTIYIRLVDIQVHAVHFYGHTIMTSMLNPNIMYPCTVNYYNSKTK